jgi:hypothetical protein
MGLRFGALQQQYQAEKVGVEGRELQNTPLPEYPFLAGLVDWKTINTCFSVTYNSPGSPTASGLGWTDFSPPGLLDFWTEMDC